MPTQKPVEQPNEPAVSGTAHLPAHGPATGTWRSSELLGGRQEVNIDHNGATYRLRLTSQGRLILTK